MNKTDLAYIAGYFDGEGCIAVWRRKPEYSSVSPRHVLMIEISSTDKPTLDWINSKFKGKLLYKHSTAKYPNQADAWKWIVSCKRAADILRALLPYLKFKKQQAELAIKLGDEMQRNLHAKRTHGKRGTPPVSPESLKYRDSLMNQIKNLKQSYKRYNGLPRLER